MCRAAGLPVNESGRDGESMQCTKEDDRPSRVHLVLPSDFQAGLFFVAATMGFSGHASQSSIYTATAVLTVLGAVAVVLRLITRLAIVRQSGWDDAFITLACVCQQFHRYNSRGAPI